ncbi:MAG: bacteriohopanetetrol glucosamine biosynthesis glycosyltransferase HpnI, partial [Bryobacteraceae bacterium]
LKPIHRIEQDFYASLASFFRQDDSPSGPRFEIVFGLGEGNDPARWTLAQLQRDFPRIPVKVVTVPESPISNPKMSKLERMLGEASHEILVLSDADIRVAPDYLRQVVRPLRDGKVGLVTCLYRGVPARQFLSTMEALGISGDFAGQVLLGRMVQGVRFGLGATMATRKQQIAEIGGIARWADYLADDYILGREIAQAGYRVHLSHTVVETVLPRRTVAEFFRQQLRWARTIRACSPQGYPGLIFVFGVPLAFFAWVIQPGSALALAILIAVLLARFLSAWTAGVLVCRDRVLAKYLWLLPLRDLFALWIWVMSFFGREVVWRDARYRLEPGGKIRPACIRAGTVRVRGK